MTLTKTFATAGGIATLIGLWITFGLPTIATGADVNNLKSFASDTRIMVLKQDLRGARSDLRETQGMLADFPESERLMSDVDELEAEIEDLRQDINLLKQSRQ